MRTAPPQNSGRAGDKANTKVQVQHSYSTVVPPVQALTHVPPTWRRLDHVVEAIVARLRRQRAAACSERVAEDFPADIQVAIGALDAVVAEGGP